MPLFKLRIFKAEKLETNSSGKEKAIQKIFQENLSAILNVDFLKSEHVTSSGRIDTLGIDRNGSPVIIEYKRTQNDNVINQGISYLKWLLDHKAEFEKLCQENSVTIEIDWTSPRLICIAQSYSKFDLDTAEFLPIKIELLKYTIYDGDLLYVDKESQKHERIATSRVFEKAVRIPHARPLQESYSVEGHLKNAGGNVREIFLKLQESIKSLDDSILEEPKKRYIAYKLTTNFVDLVIQKSSVKIYLNVPSGKLNDPYNLARDLEKPKHVGHWGNGDYEVDVRGGQVIEKAFELIKQSYSYNK
ncbi:MAG: DUF5655 domain-containing protein [Candidatus Bathyarchaeia archaeon]|jgi:predicted transport protein